MDAINDLRSFVATQAVSNIAIGSAVGAIAAEVGRVFTQGVVLRMLHGAPLDTGAVTAAVITLFTFLVLAWALSKAVQKIQPIAPHK